MEFVSRGAGIALAFQDAEEAWIFLAPLAAQLGMPRTPE